MTRTARARVWLLEHLPYGMTERPAEWFLAFLCFLSGAQGVTSAAAEGSLADVLPPVVAQGWNVALIVGGVALLIGLSSITPVQYGGYVLTRLPAYRLGCRLLGLSSVVYAAAAVTVQGSGAVMTAVVVLAFAGVFAVRLMSLGGRHK